MRGEPGPEPVLTVLRVLPKDRPFHGKERESEDPKTLYLPFPGPPPLSTRY